MKLLHIDSSILGDNSASRQLSRSVVHAWQAAEPAAVVTYRDLASDAISHFSAATLVAAGTTAELRDAAQQHEAQRRVPQLGRLRKFTLSVRAPVLLGLMSAAMLEPSSEMIATYGIPKPVLKACAVTRKS